jgi:hypothetical protein
VEGVLAEGAVDEDGVAGEADVRSLRRGAVWRMRAARISVVGAVACGSMPPAWA